MPMGRVPLSLLGSTNAETPLGAIVYPDDPQQWSALAPIPAKIDTPQIPAYIDYSYSRRVLKRIAAFIATGVSNDEANQYVQFQLLDGGIVIDTSETFEITWNSPMLTYEWFPKTQSATSVVRINTTGNRVVLHSFEVYDKLPSNLMLNVDVWNGAINESLTIDRLESTFGTLPNLGVTVSWIQYKIRPSPVTFVKLLSKGLSNIIPRLCSIELYDASHNLIQTVQFKLNQTNDYYWSFAKFTSNLDVSYVRIVSDANTSITIAEVVISNDNEPALGPVNVALNLLTHTKVDFSWNSFPGADGYSVYLNNGISTQPIIQSFIGLSYSINTLIAGKNYTILVYPYNTSGDGIAGTATFTTPEDIPPDPPTNLHATISDSTVDLGWDDSPSTDTSHYEVLRSTQMGGPYNQIGVTFDLFYRDSGLTNDITYYYAVRAVDAYENKSNFSNEVSAKPVAGDPPDTTPPGPPINVSAVGGNKLISLTWTASAATDVAKYIIFRSQTAGGPYTEIDRTASTTYIDQNLVNDEKYYYVIKAIDTSNNVSQASVEVFATTRAAPYPGIPPINYYPTGPSSTLLNLLSTCFQIGDKKPSARLRIFSPSGNGQIYDIVDELISIEVDKRWDAPADECIVRLDNKHGVFSPDYNPFKFKHLDLPRAHFEYIFFPNTRFQLFIGFEKNLFLQFTGLIDRVNINAHPDVLEFKGRNMYKRLLTQVLEPPAGKQYYTNWIASDIIADLVTKAGLPVEYERTSIIENGIEVPYVIPGLTFEYGEVYHDALNKVLETIDHRLYGTSYGTVKLEKVNFKKQTDNEDFVYDEAVELKNMQYNIDDATVRTHIRVVGGGGSDTFRDDYLWKNVCLGERRLASLQAPWWADSTEKRKLIATHIFTQLARKFRVASFAAPGNPALEIGNLIRISERVSTAVAKYQVVGIKTYYDRQAGYYDIIDVEHAANEQNIRRIALDFQKEKFEEIIYVQRFKTYILDEYWKATFDSNSTSLPFKTVTNQDRGDTVSAWSIFASGRDGVTPQGQYSQAIFDIPIPSDGYEYEFQFDYYLDCQPNDQFNVIVNSVTDGTNIGPKTWRHSLRHKLVSGNNRVIFRFTKIDPEGGGQGRPYSHMAIGDVEVYRIIYK